MWKVAVAAVLCTNVLKDKEMLKYTPRFRAQGDGLNLFMPAEISKPRILANRFDGQLRRAPFYHRLV